jgi:hypothetical protein
MVRACAVGLVLALGCAPATEPPHFLYESDPLSWRPRSTVAPGASAHDLLWESPSARTQAMQFLQSRGTELRFE